MSLSKVREVKQVSYPDVNRLLSEGWQILLIWDTNYKVQFLLGRMDSV